MHSPLSESSASAAASQRTATPQSGELDLLSLTLVEAANRIRKKQLSPVELTQAILDRIARLDSKIGAFLTVAAEQALAAAKTAEEKNGEGKNRGPLHGIPVGVKDTRYT